MQLDKLFKFGLAIWFICLIIGLTVMGVIGWVIFHFVSKVW
jgi:hypothetical protein